ncbi:MAG: hypothetical protein HYY16_15645 [Planctomycetes bacterium]|nr:hypothetical protein [Planctomycetota bacterium]
MRSWFLRSSSALIVLLAGCASAEHVRERPVDQAIREGVAFLLGAQNRDGSWGHAGDTSGFDVYAPIPGSHHAFKVATTALCVMALGEVGGVEAQGAHRRGIEYLVTHEDVRRQDPWTLYNVWAHMFAVQALAVEYRRTRDERTAEAARAHIRSLERCETMYGGWHYYDFAIGTQRPASSGTSFGTGAAVVALQEAKAAGITVPGGLLSRALRILVGCRKPDGSYVYDLEWRYWPMHLVNRGKGSLGRAQAPNCALWMSGGAISESDLKAGLDRMFRERKFLECGRKRQFPHEAYYYTSGYYYYYGHYYAARIIAELGPEDRARYGSQLLAGILPFQEPDGSWWDYRMFGYHKPYGTALALMAVALTMPRGRE